MSDPFAPEDDAVEKLTQDTETQHMSDSPTPTEQKDTLKLVETDKIKYTNTNVFMKDQVFLAPKDDTKDKVVREPLVGFNHTNTELTNLDDTPFLKLADGSSFTEDWRVAVAYANEDSLVRQTYSKSLGRAQGDWNQYVEHEGELIRPQKPRISTKGSEGKISGIKALSKLHGMLGIGSMIEVPLWNSGIWVSLKAPNDIELLNYYEKVDREKIELGKNSTGLLFANSSTYVNTHLVDLIISLIYETSMKDYTDDDLRNIIRMNDLSVLCWAMAYTMFPKGYPYQRPCVVNPEECQEVIKSTLDVGKLLWVDKSKLNEKQIRHMQRVPKTKRTRAEIEAYQNEFSTSPNAEYKNEHGFTVVLKQPSLEEHLTMGQNWINEMDQAVRNVFSDERNQANINEYINERASLTILRNYGHYIKHFIFDDGDKTTNQEGIELLLNGLTADPNAVAGLIENVNDYIDASAIALIGVPRNPCPNCGKKDQDAINQHPWILPIDGQRLFFKLRDRKLRQGIPA